MGIIIVKLARKNIKILKKRAKEKSLRLSAYAGWILETYAAALHSMEYEDMRAGYQSLSEKLLL